MLIEIVIYITLFATLFSSAFTSAFQSIDIIHKLENQKNAIESMYYFGAQLDNLVNETSDWDMLSENEIIRLANGSILTITNFSKEIKDTATSSERVLLLSIDINSKKYIFSYVQNK
jgi:hypothetical protein